MNLRYFGRSLAGSLAEHVVALGDDTEGWRLTAKKSSATAPADRPYGRLH